jgi:hypothetical protein
MVIRKYRHDVMGRCQAFYDTCAEKNSPVKKIEKCNQRATKKEKFER